MSYDLNHAVRNKDLKALMQKVESENATLDARTSCLDMYYARANILRNPGAWSGGINLGSTFTEAQAAAIADGSFADMYIDDYWSVTIDTTEQKAAEEALGEVFETTSNVKTQTTATLRILDYDYYYGQGIFGKKKDNTSNSGPVYNTAHHLLVAFTDPWNAIWRHYSDLSTKPYYESTLRRYFNTYALNIVKNFFGTSHVGYYPVSLCNAINETTGEPSGYVNEWCQMELPSEMMFYGTHLATPNDWGFDKRQCRWTQLLNNSSMCCNFRDLHTNKTRHSYYYAKSALRSFWAAYNIGIFIVE